MVNSKTYSTCTSQALWFAARDKEVARDLTPAEIKRTQEHNVTRETIAEDRKKQMA